jgi:hypothetical protein
MRQAGFEPAHPEIVGLKSTALDHSAIDATLYKHFIFFSLRTNTHSKE